MGSNSIINWGVHLYLFQVGTSSLYGQKYIISALFFLSDYSNSVFMYLRDHIVLKRSNPMDFKFVSHCVYSLYMVLCCMKAFSYMYVSYIAHIPPRSLPSFFSSCPHPVILVYSLREFHVMYMHMILCICIKN